MVTDARIKEASGAESSLEEGDYPAPRHFCVAVLSAAGSAARYRSTHSSRRTLTTP
jgi:hypothetical protein